MQKKSTNELMTVLKEKKNYKDCLSEIQPEFMGNLSSYLNSLIANVRISELSKKSGLSESYLYKLLEGRRCKPSRDTLLQLCFGLELDIDESNRLLRCGNTNTLYPRIKRDSIIIFCLNKKENIKKCDEMLFDAGEPLLLNKR
ncbi:MAG: helix-turn-helix domain-containing protein [Lachnospirales bacterium]